MPRMSCYQVHSSPTSMGVWPSNATERRTSEHVDTKVLQAAPRNARALYLRSVASARNGKDQAATEDALEAAGLRPDLPRLQLAAGSLLCRRKRYDEALALYEAALLKDVGDARYHLGGEDRNARRSPAPFFCFFGITADLETTRT